MTDTEREQRDYRALKIYQRSLYNSNLTDTEIQTKINIAKALINDTKNK